MADDLDRILETYSRVEPPAGLERRVLARCEQRRTRWWLWAAPIPVFAALLLVFMPRPAAVDPPVAPRIQAAAPRLEKAASPVVRAAKARPVRKPAVFPTPSPITAEERALLQLVATHPEALRPMERPEWKPIEIPPLSDGGRMEEQ